MKNNKPSSTPPRRWHRLDNTANLFPVITSRRMSNVFRLSLTLRRPVVPLLLQQALNITLPWFSALKVRLREGVFWHYLEENDAEALVAPEEDYPCRSINPQHTNQYLFRVLYFENRISLEVFHVLTDGTGAAQFLQALCCQYLMLAHPDDFTAQQKQTRWMADHAADTEDSYLSHYTPTKKATFNEGRAFRLRGERMLVESMSVFHLQIPVPQLLSLCRQKGVTITQYLCAQLAFAVYTQQLARRPSRWPVNIFVPVNLRNLFDSTTALNFFSNIYISLPMQGGGLSFEEVLAEVKRQFEEKLTREAMLEKLSYTVGSGYSPFIRAVPLWVKIPALRLIFLHSARSSTMGFSNIGALHPPDIFTPYITGASFLLSCVNREPFKAAVCSFEDTLTLSLTSILQSTALPRAVARQLAADGLSVTLQTNKEEAFEEGAP